MYLEVPVRSEALIAIAFQPSYIDKKTARTVHIMSNFSKYKRDGYVDGGIYLSIYLSISKKVGSLA
jgi:hypothetical protein